MEIQSEGQESSQSVIKQKIQKKHESSLSSALTTSKLHNTKAHGKEEYNNAENNFLQKIINMCNSVHKKQPHQLLISFQHLNQQLQTQIILQLLCYHKSANFKNAFGKQQTFQQILSELVYVFVQKNWKNKHIVIQSTLNQSHFGLIFYLKLFKGLSKNKKSRKSLKINENTDINYQHQNIQQLTQQLNKYCNDLFTYILGSFCSIIKQKQMDSFSHWKVIQEKLIFISQVCYIVSFDQISYSRVLQEISFLFSQNSLKVLVHISTSQNKCFRLYLQSIQLLLDSYQILNLKGLQDPDIFVNTILSRTNFWNVLPFFYCKNSLELINLFDKISVFFSISSLKFEGDSLYKRFLDVIENINFQPSIQFMEALAKFINGFKNAKQYNFQGMDIKSNKNEQITILSGIQLIVKKLQSILKHQLQDKFNEANMTALMNQSTLNALFSQLTEHSIIFLFNAFKNNIGRNPQEKVHQFIFAIFLINNQVMAIICERKQLILSIEVYLFQILRYKSVYPSKLNKEYINLSIVASYFDHTFIEQEDNFLECCIVKIAVEYPQLLKCKIIQPEQRKSLKQKCFFNIIQTNSEIQLLDKIVYYLRKFQSKVKSYFIQFLFEKLSIDICSYQEFESLSWHLIQSNVPIRSDKFSYLYDSFLLKNPLKYVECINLSPKMNQNCYKNLFNVYIQNCLLSRPKHEIHQIVSMSVLLYIRQNTHGVIQSFFNTQLPIKLYCQLMKYFVRCIYENLNIDKIFFLAVEMLFTFFSVLMHKQTIKAQEADLKQLEQMISQWKKIVDFYQKRKKSKQILFVIYLLHTNYLNVVVNPSEYQQMQTIFAIKQKIEQTRNKHKQFIVKSALQWFQEQLIIKRQEKMTKDKQQILKNKLQVEEVKYEIIQKVVILGSLIAIQKELINDQNMQNQNDLIWDLWQAIQEHFEKKVRIDINQKKCFKNNNNEFHCFKRDNQSDSFDQQINCEQFYQKRFKTKKLKHKETAKIPAIVITQHYLFIDSMLKKDGNFVNEFEYFKYVQQQILKIYANCRLSKSFQKCLNFSTIVKVQSKFRNIMQVKKY